MSLGRYAQIMRINRCHFNQVDGAKAPMSTDGCDDIWSQADREDLAVTMATAEEMIAHELGYWPAPKWITGEFIRTARVRADWWNAEFATKWKYVQEMGTQKLTLVEENAPVTYEDRDGDAYGREETAVIGDPAALYYYLSTDCDDPCNVKVFFREEDGAWDDADPRWEIRPVRADIDGTNLTIIAESCMFVKPLFWELEPGEDPNGWKVNFELVNLVDLVDVYCEGINRETPVTIYWDGVCDCASPCAHRTQAACALVTDWERGHFAARAATWNGTSHVYASPTYTVQPVKLRVDYLAGYPRDSRTCRMHPMLERAVVKLTNALLPEPPCGFCDMAERIWKRDREDVDPLTTESASMPWDMYSRGALEAWRIVKRFSRTVGGSVRGG